MAIKPGTWEKWSGMSLQVGCEGSVEDQGVDLGLGGPQKGDARLALLPLHPGFFRL